MARKPTIAELNIVIDDIVDEIDDETVLTITLSGEQCTGWLEMIVEVEDEAVSHTYWQWSARHPRNENDHYEGSAEHLVDAIQELKDAMEAIDSTPDE